MVPHCCCTVIYEQTYASRFRSHLCDPHISSAFDLEQGWLVIIGAHMSEPTGHAAFQVLNSCQQKHTEADTRGQRK